MARFHCGQGCPCGPDPCPRAEAIAERLANGDEPNPAERDQYADENADRYERHLDRMWGDA